ncbi:transcriptional regulator [Salmonella enterica subsp. enterica serovar Typhi]|uniref:Transcriptional regulator n=1 Tax=Salmonella enterica subsp. enterica serovar Typhi str. CT18 TaxID=220341 RepID=A0A717YA84_SALTI|nr:transcriptional regulator [Salmonella enterica]ECA6640207.1 transcriptional regulator [Salmonella enterica subsp. enterica serovar Typhi]HAD4270944.1 transcriptional regulator [Salmonella enterica subsp. enterica serovar Typhi str. CT18]HAD4672719.1 transcriptional regulator [Salmonella enterica subsp. enterica serovar Typhi str. CT18]HAD5470500.1 transcriptional regulator [Salmonella enterica subsp. enterica serovar Typhi str. CT18]
MDNQALRQLNPGFVQRAGSWINCFHFACLSWRQVVGVGVGLLPNVTIIRLMDKVKNLRIRDLI